MSVLGKRGWGGCRNLFFTGSLIIVLVACAHRQVQMKTYTLADIQSLPTQFMGSIYFDHAMGYHDSQFEAVDLSEVVSRFAFASEVDGILLDCFDDYQGFISLEEIRKYDLYLATRLEIKPGLELPHWLKPMLTLVPDGQSPPKLERFVTANIRSLRFVHSQDYYAPVQSIEESQPNVKEGIREFKNNCLTCHSIRGVGGNKGIPLLAVYDYSQGSDQKRFIADFLGFHYKGNSDQQSVGQFVDQKRLNEIALFLNAVQQAVQPKG